MSKRGQNEGSIVRLKDGSWRAFLSDGYENGKRKRKAFRGKTRREVRQKLTEALSSQQKGLPLSNDQITVGQYLSRWLQDSAKPKVRPRTLASYEQLIRVHIKPTLGNLKLAKLTPADIQTLLNQKLAEGLSPSSVRKIYAIIRRALEIAFRWRLIGYNPAKLVDSPSVPHHEVMPLTPEEAEQFLKAAKGDRLEALYTVAVALGLRRGEALAIRWQDIDLEKGTLRVSHTLHNLKGGGWTLAEPKSKKSRRTLHMPNFAVLALKQHRKRQLEEKMRAGAGFWQEHDFVFTTPAGTPLDGQNFYNRCFKPLLTRAGLRDIRFHDLRHSCASLLLAQGVSPRVIMETLGHSQISITMDLYSHVMPALIRDAADKMDDLLGGK